jgi:hypothetical protein
VASWANKQNIVKLALAGVNFPEIYTGNSPGGHAVDSLKKIGGHSTPATRTGKIVASGPNKQNIVKLASAGVDFPEIYTGNSPSVNVVDSLNKLVGISLLRLEQVKLWLQGKQAKYCEACFGGC